LHKYLATTMKKAQIKSLVKAARKTAKESIQLKLITDLKDFTAKLNQDSKKLNKEINKGAKQLAKKLAKEIKIDKASVVNTHNANASSDIPVTPAHS